MSRPKSPDLSVRTPIALTLGVGVVACLAIGYKLQHDLVSAQEAFEQASLADAKLVQGDIEDAFKHLYQGVRTLARMPGVREIPSSGELEPDALRSAQELYNNLASNVDVSELYILPLDLVPHPDEPGAQGRGPFVTFDELIVGRQAESAAFGALSVDEAGVAGAVEGLSAEVELEEVEEFEYRLMRAQLDKLRVSNPTEDSVSGLSWPALMGPPVVTCDNRFFDPRAPDDMRRSGFVLTVPFYGPDGNIRGGVSGVVLVDIVEQLLPTGDYALRHPDYGVTVIKRGGGVAAQSPSAVAGLTTDPGLSYSTTLPISTAEGAGWSLWVGRSPEAFATLPEVRGAWQAAMMAWAFTGFAMAAVSWMIRGAAARRAVIEEANAQLEARVAERTVELNVKNAEMRVILDNADQGFITLDRQGAPAGGRSAAVERLLGEAPAGVPLYDSLAATAPTFAMNLGMGWEAMLDDFLPRELTLAQLPTELEMNGRQVEVRYQPIPEQGDLEQMLLVVTDITEQRLREEAEATQRDLMALVDRILRDPGAAVEFMEDSQRRVDAMPSTQNIDLRNLHTLKGNCGVMGLSTLARLCHDVEQAAIDEGRTPTELEVAQLQRAMTPLAERLSALLDRRSDALDVDHDDLQQLVQALRDGADPERVAELALAWRLEPTRRRLSRLAEQAEELAGRIGKGELKVEVDDGRVRLPGEEWAPFWSAAVHLVRNAVDHGAETAEERRAAGKVGGPRIVLRTRAAGDGFIFEVEDNGRGINEEALLRRAKEKMPAELVSAALRRGGPTELIFLDGVSSREEASELSGRGVGMAAVRAACEEKGGLVTVHSKLGVGTTFRFTFPVAVGEGGLSALGDEGKTILVAAS